MLSTTAKGYLLTFLAWLAALLIALTGGYAAMELVLPQLGLGNGLTADDFISNTFNLLASLLLAAVLILIVSEALLLLLAPLFLRFMLRNYPEGRRATIIWMIVLILLYPLFPLIGLSIGLEPFVTLPLILASPFLARLLATRL